MVRSEPANRSSAGFSPRSSTGPFDLHAFIHEGTRRNHVDFFEQDAARLLATAYGLLTMPMTLGIGHET